MPKGLGLAGLGAAAAVARKSTRHVANLIRRQLLIDVEIGVKDQSYAWFLQWMNANNRAQLRPSVASIPQGLTLRDRLWARVAPRMHHLSIKTDVVSHPNGSVQAHFALLPGPGRHILRYQNAFFMVQRTRETRSTDRNGKPWETISLTTLYSQRHLIQDMFLEAHALAQQSTEGKTIIYTPRTATWEQFGYPRRKRPIDSVVLDQGLKERILDDVKAFLASETWYHDRGIPYRRGYLLHGTPGSGKSSFIQALAAELDYNIAILNLSERGLVDDRLNQLLSVVPPRTLVLLEDIDVAFGNRRVQTESDGYRGANVTFSGLLNAIDGVSSAEERILFLTTNYVERLDAALIRPGRVDMTVEVGNASRWQAEKLWERFFAERDEDGAAKRRFLQRLDEFGLIPSVNVEHGAMNIGVSMAALQGLFVYNKDDMEGAIALVSELVPKQHSDQEH